jgi:hypothetical protein
MKYFILLFAISFFSNASAQNNALLTGSVPGLTSCDIYLKKDGVVYDSTRCFGRYMTNDVPGGIYDVVIIRKKQTWTITDVEVPANKMRSFDINLSSFQGTISSNEYYKLQLKLYRELRKKRKKP